MGIAAGLDFATFKRGETWKAFGIGIVLFSIIGYAGLSMFDLAASSFGKGDGPTIAPDFEIETLNRTGYESEYTNDTGWFKLSEHRGKVVIIDFMAIDCANCHLVAEHLEIKQNSWKSGTYPAIIISVGVWHEQETLAELNETFGDPDSDDFMPWVVGTATGSSVILNETTGERGSIVEYYWAQSIPKAIIVDHEGYIVGSVSSGTPTGGWGEFDDRVESAIAGDAISFRAEEGLAEVDRSPVAIFSMGLLLGVLVYFSPCAFPILPGYISYYINLGMREDELIDAGKLEGKMPNHVVIGSLAALGQLTFFAMIGVIVFGLGSIIDLSGSLHIFALVVAILLIILGFFMLIGGTTHLMGWVQKIVDKYSTDESDERFTPRRNMYLWGIGYSAASIDCTAAAVIPFIAYLTLIGGASMITGLGGLMVSVSLLMIAVTVIVGMGRQKFIGFLRRSTGIIKATGAWMMMFAGTALTFYLTQPELIASWMA